MLIYDENLLRSTWKIGVIKELIKSKDEKIRTVKIKVKSSVVKRAINHCFPLKM